MTLSAISDADAGQLFTALRDSAFGWTPDELPALYDSMGWKLVEDVPNSGAIVTPAWGFDRASVRVLYQNGVVETMTLSLTGLAEASPAGQLAVVDVFSHLAVVAKGILGPPTKTFKGAHPRLRWRNEKTSVTLQNGKRSVLAIWATTAFQDLADESGRI